MCRASRASTTSITTALQGRAASPTAMYSCAVSANSLLTISSALMNVGDEGANQPKLALPAYDQCLKASHLFNLLDARGVISVTERAAYIGRVRALAKACCDAWLAGGQGASSS